MSTQNHNTSAPDPETREAERLAHEARDWIRRGHVPGSASLRSILALVSSKRGVACGQRLSDAIDAWYPTRDTWLPALIDRLALYHPPQPSLSPTQTEPTAPRRPPTGGLVARMRTGF